ncbi:MAG: hypothetical protein Q9214_007307, partial [Letrouitia sp. 1 TL-2023]
PAVVGLAGIEELAIDGEPVLAVAAAVALAAQVATVGKVTLTLEGEVSRITPREAEAFDLEHTYRKPLGQPEPFLWSVMLRHMASMQAVSQNTSNWSFHGLDARTAQSGRSSNPTPAHRAMKEARQTESMYFILDFLAGEWFRAIELNWSIEAVRMYSWEVGGKSKCGGGKDEKRHTWFAL